MRKLSFCYAVMVTATFVALSTAFQEKTPPAKQERSRPRPSQELLRAAEATDIDELKSLYREFATPHDRIAYDGRVGELKVRPLPMYADADPSQLVTPVVLDPIDQTEAVRTLDAGDLDKILKLQCYENKAIEAIEGLLRRETKLPQLVKLEAKEWILDAVLRFHVSQSGQGGLRQGEQWATVRNTVHGELYDARTELLALEIDAKEWRESLALLRRFVEQYPDPQNADRVAPLVVKFVEGTWNAPEGKHRLLLAELRELHEEHPKHPVLAPVPGKLEEKARILFKEAEPLVKSDEKRAIALLELVRKLWPDLKELQSGQLTVTPQAVGTLLVGVRSLPTVLSPTLAVSDVERQSLDLLFESLLETTIDESTGQFRYRPELAESLPGVLQRGPRSNPGRFFSMSPLTSWSDGRRLNAFDVRFSVNLLREGHGVYRGEVWREMLDQVIVSGNPHRVAIPLVRGCIDPLAWMTFKIVPQHANVKGSEFAVHPIGSGPYRLEKKLEPKAKSITFQANPHYGKRPSRAKQPGVQTIVLVQTDDPGDDLATSKIHFAMDLTAKEVAELDKGNAGGKIVLPQALPKGPRQRIYFLAVNHRHPLLADRDIRQGLALAVDRVALLNKHFRAGLRTTLHTPLAGLYPVGSWAEALSANRVSDPNRDPLHESALALGRFRKGMKAKRAEDLALRLVYPSGNPALAEAMKAMKVQLETTLGKEKPTLTVRLIEQTPNELWTTVTKTHNYDLAYTSYTFPDQTYWLGPLLGTTGADDDNILGYHNARLLDELLQVRDHREFEEIRDVTKKIATEITLDMPIVPLWQLDPLHAWNIKLKTADFNPEKVFSNVGRWTLDGG